MNSLYLGTEFFTMKISVRCMKCKKITDPETRYAVFNWKPNQGTNTMIVSPHAVIGYLCENCNQIENNIN